VAGKALDACAQLADPRCLLAVGIAHRGRHALRKRRRERGHGTDGRRAHPLCNQRLRADEDVEAFDEVRREGLPRRVRDLEAGEVRGDLAQTCEHLERNGVPTRARELVDVERRRSAGCGGRGEVREQRVVVQREVRRRDHRDPLHPCAGRVVRELDRPRGRLGAAVRDHLQAAGEEKLRHALALLRREEDPLAGRSEREHPVQAAQKVAIGPESVLVQAGSALAKRRQRGGDRTPEHARNLRFAAVTALRIERDGPVLRLTLARPGSRNAFDAALIAELREAFSDVGDARAVVLAGEGESFCAGADVEWMRSSAELSYEENVQDARRLRLMLETVNECPAPVVVRVHGHALGGGAGLVACADIAVAAQETEFAFSEVKLGIVPSVISPFALAKIGPGAARRYFVTGERFDADTAFRIGLVHEVAEDPDPVVDRLVDELLSAGPEAARHAKRLVLDRPDGLATERRIAERRTSEEGQEGLRAFLDKRKPSW
jgi:methylglutaconyl-CoA hydratase